jgi:O-palmitoleoyl-L-serine hydrolase
MLRAAAVAAAFAAAALPGAAARTLSLTKFDLGECSPRGDAEFGAPSPYVVAPPALIMAAPIPHGVLWPPPRSSPAAASPLPRPAAAHPLAVCNDGTPAGYYFSPSPSGSADWVVHQQGGGWCFDAASCRERSPSLTSSKAWAPAVTVGGLFAAADPRLAAANLVYAPYCSSDAWAGHIGAADVPFGFHFRGADIVDAIVADLAAARGLGAAAHTTILYSGCSAGARGVLFNLDRVAAVVASAVPPGHLAAYGGLLDSAFWVDLTPANASVVPFRAQAADVLAMANVSVPRACAAAYPPPDTWKCLMGATAVPFLTSPYLLHAYQYDRFQLTSDLGVPGSAVTNATPAERVYDELFRSATRSAALADTITPAQPGTAAVLPACYKHCATEDPGFASITVGSSGVSLETAVAAWMYGEGAATTPRFVMDDCAGFNCGATCPAV